MARMAAGTIKKSARCRPSHSSRTSTFLDAPLGGRFHPPSLAAEKAPHDAQELREPVVMEPVAGPVDADHLGLTEVADPPVLGGIAGAALLAVEQEGRACDPRPEQLDVAARHVVGRPRAHVVVELPAVGPVLVLVRAVL